MNVPTPGLEWSKTLVEGKRVTFAEAEKAVAELGDGWRLPTRRELESIQDLSRHNPCIDTAEFPDTQSESYWTSTPCAWSASARWAVDFNAGSIYSFHLYGNACVRAVREGATWQAEQSVPVEGEWPHTMDAQVWARKWLEITADKPEIATDEGAMIGWFANAIMAGYDAATLVSNPQGKPRS